MHLKKMEEAMSKSRISALDRLRGLPEVFTLNTAASHLGCSTKQASTYINRWGESGLTSSLGPRTGMHFNLLRNPNAASELRMDAIGYLFPGAMVGGVSAVHAAGWTTQFPRKTEIIIPKRRSFPSIDEAEVSCRPLKWIKEARNWTVSEGPVPYLNPAFALADCVANDVWTPDPDDIEWEEVDVPALVKAFAWFDVEIPEDWVEEMEYASREPLDIAP
jgi:hypothetical protein